jgi:AraC-like DNA-binding protein
MPGSPIALAPGDFVMTSRARPYALRDAAESPIIRFDDLIDLLKLDFTEGHKLIDFGGGGATTKVLLGCYDFDTSGNNPFFASLPAFIYIRAEQLQTEPWLETTLRFLSAECASGKLGSSISVRRLTELVFVQAIRAFISLQQAEAHKSGWLNAVSDPQIGQAVSLMHEHPEEPWTVAELAHRVGMSRSAFAARFKDLADVPPLDYLTTWRMQKARAMLKHADLSIFEIADHVGYKSEAAFSKAFKREIGQAPGNFRKQVSI